MAIAEIRTPLHIPPNIPLDEVPLVTGVLERALAADPAVTLPPHGEVYLRTNAKTENSVVNPQTALLYEGGLLRDYYLVMDKLINRRPAVRDPKNHYAPMLRENFGIFIWSNPKTRLTFVNNFKTSRSIQLTDGYQQKLFTPEIRKAIAAIALAPKDFWEQIRTGGLLLGNLSSETPAGKWRVTDPLLFSSKPTELPGSAWKGFTKLTPVDTDHMSPTKPVAILADLRVS